MNKIFHIAKWEFTEKIKRKFFILSTLLTPLFMIAIGYFTGISNELRIESPQIMGIYNESKIPMAEFKSLFEGNRLGDGQPKYIIIDLQKDVQNHAGDLNILDEIVNSEEISGCLIIKAENSGNFSTKLITKYPIQQVEKLLIQNILMHAKLNSKNIPYKVKLETKTTSGMFREKNEAEIISDFYASFILIILLLVMILFSGGIFVRGLAEEKSNRIIEILLSSCKVKEILWGKIFGLSLLGIFQISIWIIFGILFLGKQFFVGDSSSLSLQLIYFLLGYLFYSSIFIGFGSLVNSEYDSQQLTTNISIFLIIPIILALQIIQSPNSFMATLLSIFPLTSAPIMILRLNSNMLQTWEILLPMVLLLFSTGMFIMLAAKVFGKGLLLFGKRPKLFNLFKWLNSK